MDDNMETTQALTAPADDTLNTQVRMAKLLAESQFLPKHYQGRPADCLVAIQWAQRSGRDPLELLQNTYVVHGSPGMYTRYMIAQERRAKVFDAPIRFETEGGGRDMVVTAYGMIDGARYDASASMQMAIAEGWAKNKKYDTMQEHMLKWRAATFLIRFTAPEVLLGMNTVEELEDMRYAEPPKRIAGSESTQALSDRMRGEVEIVESPVKEEGEDPEERCGECGAGPSDMHEEFCPTLAPLPEPTE
jgi:hypothetical protein